MKVTRMQRGYKIRLSDGEMEALEHLVGLGKADMKGAPESLSLAGRRGMNKLLRHDALNIDEDNRKEAT